VITVLEGLPDNVLAVEAAGKVTDEDYEQVLVPAVRAKRAGHDRIRFVYVLGEEFEGWTAGALWDDAKLGLKDPKTYEKVAVVTDRDWLHHAVKALGWMIPGEVRAFRLSELEAAKAWASS
jgi:hypothetical protein